MSIQQKMGSKEPAQNVREIPALFWVDSQLQLNNSTTPGLDEIYKLEQCGSLRSQDVLSFFLTFCLLIPHVQSNNSRGQMIHSSEIL